MNEENLANNFKVYALATEVFYSKTPNKPIFLSENSFTIQFINSRDLSRITDSQTLESSVNLC